MRLLRLFFLLPLLVLLIGFFHPITAYSQDLGRHLLTGQIILKTLSIPSTNLFSYTYPTFPFINHHWGSEVIFYLTKTISGDLGLFILSLLVIGTACTVIFLYCAKRASVLTLVFLAILYLRVLFERTDLRPELFSFLILSVMVTILYTYREHSTKFIFLLIPLQLLWANFHIYFPIGILISLLFVIDEVITHRKKPLTSHTKILLFVFIAMGGVTLLNPHFLEGALYPLRVFQNYGYTIEENQTPFFLQSLGFSKPTFLYLEISVVLLFTSFFLSWKKTSIVDWLISIVFTIIAFSAVRNFPLFVFATFIPASLAFSRALEPVLKWVKNKPPIYFLTLCFGLIGFFVWQVKSVQSIIPTGYRVDEQGKKALDFVINNHIQGPIFNNFDIGSYIEYRLYPTQKVFIDGRPEAYPASFIQDTYIKMQEDPALFNKVADKYHFNSIIFSHTDQTPWAEQFLKDIIQNPDWTPVYLDSTMLILTRKSPGNTTLIQKYGFNIKQSSFALPKEEGSLRQLGHFYSIVGATSQLERVLHEILTLSPHDCSTLRLLATLYTQTNNPAASSYIQQFNTTCPL
jgi:hypothetical protein